MREEEHAKKQIFNYIENTKKLVKDSCLTKYDKMKISSILSEAQKEL